MKITQEELKQLLEYEPDTGIFRWKVSRGSKAKVGEIAGFVDIHGYHKIGLNGRAYRAHRLAWLWVHGKFPEGDTDHINGDKVDNRISNLRDVSRCVNNQNWRRANADSKSQVLGVSKQGNKYRAQIYINGKTKKLGYFWTADDAHAAYLEAKRKHHEGCTI